MKAKAYVPANLLAISFIMAYLASCTDTGMCLWYGFMSIAAGFAGFIATLAYFFAED